MNAYDWIQLIIFTAAFIALTPLLGDFMARVFEGKRHVLSTPLGWMENGIYLASGVDRNEEMNWKRYAWAVTAFNVTGFVVVFLLQMFQAQLPLNPQVLPNTTWHLAFNTAMSFITNTNWQSYGGETTMSYLTQMLGLAVQNFVSAATGIAVLLALIRGLARRSSATLGNFWTDLTRTTVYVLLPLSIILALALVSQGVVQTFSPYIEAHTLEGAKQTLALGPAASQIAIKQLGTNGGGFFNVNSAHPFENPTPFSNWLEMLSILLIPAALVYSYGVMVKSKRQGWVIFAAMFFMWAVSLGVSLWAEYSANPVLGAGALMEGKETRFGVVNSVLWSVSTTVTSNGSVNAMHASLSPISGGVALFNIMLGEIVFGGVGSGLYGMLLFVLLAVFLAGLMVGRTPEYLGKKIETQEIAMVVVAILLPSICILLGSGAAAVLPSGLSSLTNKGPHGLSEILYAFSSASQNNGSAFAGLDANTPFYNVMLGLCMLVGRFGVIYPVLAIAGSLAAKKYAPPSEGTFHTDKALFLVLLVVVIPIVGALTHLPALSLGPVVEHFLMVRGVTF
jgi:K+-transporting ATPase ATPase A chain